MLRVLWFVSVSDSNLGVGLNGLVVKIRFECVFNQCEESISAFDILFGNAADCRKQGEISDQ